MKKQATDSQKISANIYDKALTFRIYNLYNSKMRHITKEKLKIKMGKRFQQTTSKRKRYLSTWIYIYVCMHTCVSVYVCVYLVMCILIHTHTHTNRHEVNKKMFNIINLQGNKN